MASWHQMQAMRRNGPLVIRQWSIVTDPPGAMMTVMGFPDEKTCRETFELWKANGRAEHSYVRAPDRGRNDANQ